jgi:hypothetical protein
MAVTRAWSLLPLLASLFPLGACGSNSETNAVTPPGDGGGPPRDAASIDVAPPEAAATCDSQAACDGGVPSCPPGTVLSAGQCDDIRCPDELPSGSTGIAGLPSNTNAWPRFRHDNRNSGWTRAKVAPSPKLKWSKPIGFGVGPALDAMGRIFLGSETTTQSAFDCLDVSGNVVYSLALASPDVWDDTIPAVRVDGVAYFSTADAPTQLPTFNAVTPSGTLAWSHTTTDGQCGGGAHPIVTDDGTLVYGQYPSAYAFDPNGNLLWKTDLTSGPGQVAGGIASSCDGSTMYVGGANGWTTLDIKTGATLWRVPVPSLTSTGPQGAVTSSPVVAFDGTMYGIDDQGVGWAIDPHGKVLWTKPIGTGPYGERVSSAKLGNLLIVVADGNLVAVDTSSGATVWNDKGAFAGGPVVDGNLRIYANDSGTVRAFDIDGNPLWQVPTGSTSTSEMAIGPDGTIYVQTDTALVAIQ